LAATPYFRLVLKYINGQYSIDSNDKQATPTRRHLPFKPVNKKMVVVIGHGSYLTHQMCKYHVRRDAAKLRILSTHQKINTQ